MMYQELYQLLWHDTDAKREVRPSALLTYMQETANRQFKNGGRPLDAMRDEEGLAFILGRLALEIDEPLYAYDEILVKTFTCPPHGATFPRGFLVEKAGRVVARGMSQWALLHLADRSLARADEVGFSFGDEEELSLSIPLRSRAPREATFERVGEHTVAYAEADYNLHMNNTRYPDLLCGFLPDPFAVSITGMSLSYHHEAKLGHTLTVARAAGEAGSFYFKLFDGETLCLEATIWTAPFRGATGRERA